jgi:hypothetical protein
LRNRNRHTTKPELPGKANAPNAFRQQGIPQTAIPAVFADAPQHRDNTGQSKRKFPPQDRKPRTDAKNRTKKTEKACTEPPLATLLFSVAVRKVFSQRARVLLCYDSLLGFLLV